MNDVAVRVGNRAKLELLSRVRPLRNRADRLYAGRLLAHQPLVPAVPAERERILDVVRQDGACVSSLDELALPGTAELQEALTRLTAQLSARPAEGTGTVRPPLDEILAESAVWQWGLRSELLDMVESYLGLPARYYGADLRCERADGRAVGVRQWHRDVEDHQMFKILVWLNDVEEDGGPFEYVSRAHTERLTGAFRYVSGFVGDEEMDRYVPRSEWRKATGPIWTAVVADTRMLFHRAMPPTRRDRYSVTFSFTSRTPFTTLPVPPPTDRQRELATAGLDARQLACLPGAFTG
jgi:hypothetical protein